MHKVKCFYCGQIFDRDKEEAVSVGVRRYAHVHCAKTGEKVQTQEEKDRDALEAYIRKLFNTEYVDARIKKQIQKYKQEYNYTYSGMLKTLIWWFEIKGGSLEKANGGIGIIPYVYQEACNYYYALYLAQIANADKEITDYIPRERAIEILSPRAYVRPPKLFNLDDEEDDNSGSN